MKSKERAGDGPRPSVHSAGPDAASVSPEQVLLEKKIQSAKRVITFERVWPRFWLPVGVCILFIIVSGFGLWEILSPEAHRAVLYAFGAALALAFLPLLLVRKATRDEAIFRLQQVSKIPHRPITAYTDTLSVPQSEQSAALWTAHKKRASALLEKLRPGAPHPRVDKHDPIALRAALVLVLAVVVAWQWSGLRKQVEAAFVVPAIEDASDLRIDAWVTPPAYTRKAPFLLPTEAGVQPVAAPVGVPENSSLSLKVNHPDAKDFQLAWRADGEPKPAPIERDASQSNERFAAFATQLNGSGRLALQRNGRDIQSWTIAVQPDENPSIAFTGPIAISQRSALLFKYEVKDDYGVVSAEAQIDRVENGIALGESARGGGAATSLTPKSDVPVGRLGKPPVFPLALPSGAPKTGEAKTYRDLTAHPWAGLPVIVTLIARDEAGQIGESAPRGFILPERKFTKPLARALIDQRRSLVENPVRTKNVMTNLNALGRWAESEEVAPAIYLGIRSVFRQLQNTPDIATIESVVDHLWELAVRIEDGDLPDAERDLRAAQQRLMEALQQGASEEEVQRLMSDLRQALNKFLQAMAEQQQKNQAENGTPPSASENTVTSNELQQLLDKIEDLAKLGSQDMAQQLLSELQDILENLQTGQQSAGASEQQRESLQQLDELSRLMQEQQKLLDETFRAQQEAESRFSRDPFGDEQNGEAGEQQQGQQGQMQGGQQAGSSPGQLRQRQGDIQKRLREMLEQMDKGQGQGQGQGQGDDTARQRLQDAERAMGRAGDALGDEQLDEATGQETRALNALRQGTRAMAEQMMSQKAGRPGRGQASRDPFGRQSRGQNDPGDSVKVPEEIDIQRAREILDELRRRAGEQSRPALELDYIERLIKRF